jgi:uncharacterized secreted protein with C-terminal beta-propeller domain
VNAEQPGLLAPSSFNVGGTQYVAALFPDGAIYVLPRARSQDCPRAVRSRGDTSQWNANREQGNFDYLFNR